MQIEKDAVIAGELNAIFASLELSRSTWLITSLSPGAGERMSRHVVDAGNMAGLLERFTALRTKAEQRTGHNYPIVSIYEAGLDGFWIHRVLVSEGVESHIVDAASIAASRRKRRVKTDRVDGETLVRTLLAYKRGQPRVCAMLRVPSPEDEDRRRIGRERKILMHSGASSRLGHQSPLSHRSHRTLQEARRHVLRSRRQPAIENHLRYGTTVVLTLGHCDSFATGKWGHC